MQEKKTYLLAYSNLQCVNLYLNIFLSIVYNLPAGKTTTIDGVGWNGAQVNSQGCM